jgi:hypothetical protein
VLVWAGLGLGRARLCSRALVSGSRLRAFARARVGSFIRPAGRTYIRARLRLRAFVRSCSCGPGLALVELVQGVWCVVEGAKHDRGCVVN